MDRYEQAEAYLYGRINFERAHAANATSGDFKLDRMRELLRRLGDPQDRIPCIHIAGTKGKGSTAAMCAAMLQAAGYRVGLYTSPHVSRFEERMTVDGDLPSQSQVVELVNRVRGPAAEMDAESERSAPTFFEVLTAMAWLHFLAERVDIVVLEVGLGGRLDSTNLCRPEVCVITSISRDHTNILGPTLAHIAREKAGIIKTGIPILSGAEEDEAREAIRQIAREQHAPLQETGDAIRHTVAARPAGGIAVDIQTPWARYEDLTIPLSGLHQGANAALAVTAIDVLRSRGWRIPADVVRTGLRQVAWPLRIEVVQRRPTVILDAAHNWASIKALLRTLDEQFTARRRLLIFSGTKDKDVSGLLRQLLPRFDTVILTQYQHNPRCVPVQQLAVTVRGLCDMPFHTAPRPAEAWQLAQRLSEPEDLICATGSFFLAAEMRDLLLGRATIELPAPAVAAETCTPTIQAR